MVTLKNDGRVPLYNVTGAISCAGRWLKGDWVMGGTTVKVTLDNLNRVVQFEGIPGVSGTVASALTPQFNDLTLSRGNLIIGGITHQIEYNAITKTLKIDWAPQVYSVVMYGGAVTTVLPVTLTIPTGGDYVVKAQCDLSDMLCSGNICSVHGDFAIKYTTTTSALNMAIGNLDLSIPRERVLVGPPITDTWEVQ